MSGLNKVPMTVAGEKRLKEELHQLKTVTRPGIIEAIAEARAHGDLKENAEYHAAREQQSFTEGRIQEIEGKLSNCQIIDISKIENKGKVLFGVTVDIINIDTDEKKTYKIVGEDEADIKLNRIFAGSPIARALMGKEVGDVASVETPGGLVEYEIEAVRHEV
jgi:transcription elongation factor GreA